MPDNNRISDEYESEEMAAWYRDIIDNTHDLIQCVDSKGKLIFVNQAWLSALKYTVEDLDNITLGDIIHPDSKEHCSALFEQVRKGKAISEIEATFVAKDGTPVRVEGNVGVKFDRNGNFECTRGIFRDVTARKQSDEALIKQDALLKKVFDLLPVGLWFADANGKLLSGNPEGVRIWEGEPRVGQSNYGVFKAKRLPSGEEIAPDDWALAHTINKGITIADEMLEIEDFKGQKKIVLNYTAPVLDDKGEIQGAIVVNQDITERKKAEERLLSMSTAQQNLNSFMLEIYKISDYDELTKTIVKQLDQLFSPIATSFSEYDQDARVLRIKELKANHHMLELLVKVGGERLLSTATPVSETMHKELLTDRIKVVSSIFELFGGALPKAFSNRIDKGLNVKSYCGFSYIVDDQVFGTTVIALAQEPETYLIELLKSYAHFISISLKRILSEQSLSKTTAQLKTITDNMSELVAMTDAEGRLTYVSGNHTNIIGYTKEELLGRHVWEIIYGEDAEKLAKQFRESFSTGQGGRADSRIVRKDGTLVWVETVGSLLFDNGKPSGALFITRDISDRKKAEETLAESENRFQRMLGLVPDMVSIHDPDMNIVYSNWRGFAEVPVEKRIANTKCYKTYRNYEQVCPDCNALEVFKTKETFESEVQLTEGTWLDLRIIPLLGPDNEIEYYMEWVRDISDIKNIENEIRALNKELEYRVSERTIELEAVNRELQSFAYSISHDFRAPLRALNAFSAKLIESYKDQLDEQGIHYLKRISNAGMYMSELVDELLKLSRITRVEINKEKVDISRMVEEILMELQEAEPERQVEAAVEPGLKGKGDITLIKAALDNLISNAWKFSSKEDLAIIEIGRITIDGTEVFFVRDNGVGFNMAYADKLFGAFQRLHSMDEFPGTGIGLATVQRIINRHGGKVWADSEVGKGATFYFTLDH